VAAPHSDTDDMVTELVKDHREVEEMFQKLERPTLSSDERNSTLQDVITELVRHSVAEEQYLYPTAREALDDGDSIADHEIEEHSTVEKQMKELERMDPADAGFTSTLHQFIGDVRHHIEEEEGELFPRLQKACTPEQLRELGDKIRTIKKIAPTHPHPSSPSTPPGTTVAGPLAGLFDRVRDAVTSKD
jgi:hemerythrin superfamily protein